MATPRKKKPMQVANSSPKGTHQPFRILRVKKTDDLKTLYAKAKKAFTAADLQLYTQDDEMIPGEQLAKELNEMVRQAAKRKKKARR